MITKQPVNEVFSEYISEKEALNLSQATIDAYLLQCNLFFKAVGIVTIDDMTKQNYQKYISLMIDEQHKKAVSVASYCRSIRAFYYWCMDVGYIDEQFKLRLPKYEKPVKRIYSETEMQKLLEKPSKDCSEVEFLCWTFANLCACTGIRLSSALAIKVCDLEGEWIYIDRTKNRAGLKLHLNKEMQRILRRYISSFHLTEDNFLFSKADGTAYKASSIKKMMNRYNDARGVDTHGIHRYRHTFAALYYQQTKDVFGLCKLLGHSSVAVTENYLSSIGTSMISETNPYNPQEQFTENKNRQRRRGRMKKGRD